MTLVNKWEQGNCGKSNHVIHVNVGEAVLQKQGKDMWDGERG